MWLCIPIGDGMVEWSCLSNCVFYHKAGGGGRQTVGGRLALTLR